MDWLLKLTYNLLINVPLMGKMLKERCDTLWANVTHTHTHTHTHTEREREIVHSDV